MLTLLTNRTARQVSMGAPRLLENTPAFVCGYTPVLRRSQRKPEQYD